MSLSLPDGNLNLDSAWLFLPWDTCIDILPSWL